MGVVARLNALDERAGVRGPLDARRWHGRLRLWWVPLATALAAVVGSIAYSAVNDGSALAAALLAFVPGVFFSGFYYNERLRSLGRRPRLLEVPGDWPAPSPDA